MYVERERREREEREKRERKNEGGRDGDKLCVRTEQDGSSGNIETKEIRLNLL